MLCPISCRITIALSLLSGYGLAEGKLITLRTLAEVIDQSFTEISDPNR